MPSDLDKVPTVAPAAFSFTPAANPVAPVLAVRVMASAVLVTSLTDIE
mgnify:CR=1 FL=1